MSNLTINLDFSGGGDGGKKSTEKNRHSRFPRKRNLTQNDQQMKHKHDLKYQGPPPWRNGAKHPSLPSATHNKSSSHIPSPAHARSSAPKPGSSSSSTSLTITVKNTTNSEQSKTSTSTYNHTASLPGAPAPFCNPLKYLAIDCEMVGTGPKGRNSELARCSIVSYDGDVVYDKYIKPANPVTDYRTRWSGISWKQLVNATLYTQARKEILKILQGKVVIGHAIHNDFKSMSYSHPAVLTRDTSRIPLLNQKAGFGGKECASLKRLTKALLNRDIQTGKKGHSSVEDAKATMELYKVVEVEWERTLASRTY